jgi:4-hydroxy-tetrahydrodipicolinate synthase
MVSFRGCFTALVTPFVADGSAVDWDAHERLVEAQIEGGVNGLVPCGTTGEAPTLSDAEHLELVKRTVNVARGRVPVVAGTGTNSTHETIQLSRAALEARADAVMIVVPYYSKPNQAGIFRHVELVAKSVSGPIALYNVPGRTVVNLETDTLSRILDACSNVVALKDASNNVLYCQSLSPLGDRIAVLSGDDALTLPLMSVGAVGVISVTVNLYPRETTQVVSSFLAGDWAAAKDAHLRLCAVHAALFAEPNPVLVKAALAARGRMTPSVRPPLVEAAEGVVRQMMSVIDAFEEA